MPTKAQLESELKVLRRLCVENEKLLAEAAKRVPPLDMRDLSPMYDIPRNERGARPMLCFQISGRLDFYDGSYYELLVTLRRRPSNADVVALSTGIAEYISETLECGSLIGDSVVLSICNGSYW